jgi:hypothetical protein
MPEEPNFVFGCRSTTQSSTEQIAELVLVFIGIRRKRA